MVSRLLGRIKDRFKLAFSCFKSYVAINIKIFLSGFFNPFCGNGDESENKCFEYKVWF